MENPSSALSRHQFQSKKAMKKGNDRISKLPNAVLHYILSLMPMKFMVRTSILSRRWRNLWKDIWSCATALDFGVEFATGQTPEEFASTVNRYLQLHRAKEIEMFRLSLLPRNPLYRSYAEIWVKFAVAKRTKKLDINFRRTTYYHILESVPCKLLNSIFSCDSITHLNLSCCYIRRKLNFQGYSYLKALHLRTVKVTNGQFESVLSNCPLLEELILRNCYGLTCFKVSSPCLPLKRLTVVDCWDADVIEIFAPNLLSFRFYGNFIPMDFQNISSLVDVFLNGTHGIQSFYVNWITVLHYLRHKPLRSRILICIRWGPHSSYPCLKISMLEGFEFIKHCTVEKRKQRDANEWTGLEFLAKSSTQWDPPDVWFLEKVLYTQGEYRHEYLPITFHNLQELQLLMNWVGESYLPCTYSFFKNCPCPCLEKLFIQLSSGIKFSRRINWSEELSSEDTPDIVFGNLKVIKMNDFRGLKDEMQLVKFFLKKAIVLESMVLVAPKEPVFNHSASEPKFTGVPLGILREQLLILAKASSSDAQILICEYLDDDGALVPTHTEIYHQGMHHYEDDFME